jgi:S-disulfanyl-L-cysteine oxidoreductase SoxD
MARVSRKTPSAIAAACVAALVAAAVSAQNRDASTSVWDGVYTDAQAARGESAVRTHCAVCHAPDLTGREGPALAGDSFMRQWSAHPLPRLLAKIRDTMPPGAAMSVSDADKLDALAFILQQNGMPSGAAELLPDAAVLASDRPIGRDGRPRTGALVQSIGCLARTGAQAWALARASEPALTTLDALSLPATPPPLTGATEIRLLNVFPSPAQYVDRVVRVRGLLVEDASGLAINVVSIAPAGAAC